jgi:hypothetical protein
VLLPPPSPPPPAPLQSQQYSPAWRSHVLAHLPFYTQLLPAFLELAYSQMAYCPKPAVKEAYRVSGRGPQAHSACDGG